MDGYLIILQRNQVDISNTCWYLGVPPQLSLSPLGARQYASTFSAMAYDQLSHLWDAEHLQLGWYLPPEPVDHIILFLPKSKPETEMQLRQAATYLKSFGGRLWVVGHNKGGIKSFATLARKSGLNADRIDSARHCALFEIALQPDQNNKPEVSIPSDLVKTIELDNGLKIASYPGVFGHGKLDPGTRVLLSQLSTSIRVKKGSRVLDFGSGAGVIGLSVVQKFPDCSVDLLDVNWLAYLSSQQSARINHLSNVNAFCQDGLNGMKPGYDLIISNPPFHEGVKTHYEVTETFLEQAIQYLSPQGQLLLVANQFLNYEPILERKFKQVTEQTRQNGFKVLLATR